VEEKRRSYSNCGETLNLVIVLRDSTQPSTVRSASSIPITVLAST